MQPARRQVLAQRLFLSRHLFLQQPPGWRYCQHWQGPFLRRSIRDRSQLARQQQGRRVFLLVRQPIEGQASKRRLLASPQKTDYGIFLLARLRQLCPALISYWQLELEPLEPLARLEPAIREQEWLRRNPDCWQRFQIPNADLQLGWSLALQLDLQPGL